jgi:hypothetical protein
MWPHLCSRDYEDITTTNVPKTLGHPVKCFFILAAYTNCGRTLKMPKNQSVAE